MRDGGVRDAWIMKWLALLYLLLVAAALALVHYGSYEPGVSYILLYLAVSVLVTGSVALLLLPAEQFGGSFDAGVYIFYAAFIAMIVFFTGESSSQLYVLFFPLLFAPAFQGSARMGALSLGAVLVCYTLAMLPGLVEVAEEGAAMVIFRLAVFGMVGIFSIVVGREVEGVGEKEYVTDEDGSVLLEMFSGELEASKGERVGVILIDPGPEVEDLGVLLQRVRERIGEPVVLKDGPVFGVVLGGIEGRSLESAARRVLSVAGSLQSGQSRAGGAMYPKDGRNAGEVLAAVGEALEEAYTIDSPTAIVVAGRGSGWGGYRQAR
jgi:hypothetical protein